jgi:hypothetical protein
MTQRRKGSHTAALPDYTEDTQIQTQPSLTEVYIFVVFRAPDHMACWQILSLVPMTKK